MGNTQFQVNNTTGLICIQTEIFNCEVFYKIFTPPQAQWGVPNKFKLLIIVVHNFKMKYLYVKYLCVSLQKELTAVIRRSLLWVAKGVPANCLGSANIVLGLYWPWCINFISDTSYIIHHSAEISREFPCKYPALFYGNSQKGSEWRKTSHVLLIFYFSFSLRFPQKNQCYKI